MKWNGMVMNIIRNERNEGRKTRRQRKKEEVNGRIYDILR